MRTNKNGNEKLSLPFYKLSVKYPAIPGYFHARRIAPLARGRMHS